MIGWCQFISKTLLPTEKFQKKQTESVSSVEISDHSGYDDAPISMDDDVGKYPDSIKKFQV